jgi:hypothetical protein
MSTKSVSFAPTATGNSFGVTPIDRIGGTMICGIVAIAAFSIGLTIGILWFKESEGR